MANRDKIFDTALNLPPKERAELAAKLVESLVSDQDYASEAEIDEAWDVELERRVLELREGRVEGVPWEEVQRSLDERRRRRLARRG